MHDYSVKDLSLLFVDFATRAGYNFDSDADDVLEQAESILTNAYANRSLKPLFPRYNADIAKILFECVKDKQLKRRQTLFTNICDTNAMETAVYCIEDADIDKSEAIFTERLREKIQISQNAP